MDEQNQTNQPGQGQAQPVEVQPVAAGVLSKEAKQ